ncbi:MAG: hypothetical protein Q7R52_04880 [archaeon]|nr:hypothetical protein [archaeon]
MDDIRTNCLGHLIKRGQCASCSEDYDISHKPNNYDCPLRNKFLERYNEVTNLLLREGIQLSESTMDGLVLQIFLANILNPNVTSKDIIRGISARRNIEKDTSGVPLQLYA